MDDKPRKLCRGYVSEPVAEGVFCRVEGEGLPSSMVGFTTPIDLLPNDEVVVDPRDGSPLTVRRGQEGHLVWANDAIATFIAGRYGEAFTPWRKDKPAGAAPC